MPRSGPKSIVCTVCGKSFGRRPDLNRHAHIHEPDAVRFYCAYPGCHHSTLQKSNLKTHYISTHLRQRPHRCRFDGCTKAYGDASALIRHEKRNHGYFRKEHKLSEPVSTRMLDALIKLDSPDHIELPGTPSLYYSSGSASSPAPSVFSSSSFLAPSLQQSLFESQSTDAFLHEMLPELFPDPKLLLDIGHGYSFNTDLAYPAEQPLLCDVPYDSQAAYFPSFVPLDPNIFPEPLLAPL